MTRRESLIVLKNAKRWMKPGELAAFICDVSDELYGSDSRRPRPGELQQEYAQFWEDASKIRNE